MGAVQQELRRMDLTQNGEQNTHLNMHMTKSYLSLHFPFKASLRVLVIIIFFLIVYLKYKEDIILSLQKRMG